MVKINKVWAILLTILGVAFLIGLVFLTWYHVTFYYVPKLSDKLGRAELAWTGDSFGAVNTLFSGLAFVGIILTIILQMRELSLQRRELTKSANAQQKISILQIKSIQLLARQALFSFDIEVLKSNSVLTGFTSHRPTAKTDLEEQKKKIIELLQELENLEDEENKNTNDV